MGKLIFWVTVMRWVLLEDNNEHGIDFTTPQEWRITPFGWGTVLEIIKGILSPSDSTKTQLLYTMKEGNQWDRKRLRKTTEASSFSLQDCQILSNAGLYWIKYSLSLLWPLSKSNSLYWALGTKHTRIPDTYWKAWCKEGCYGLCSCHSTWDSREDISENKGLCEVLQYGLP